MNRSTVLSIMFCLLVITQPVYAGIDFIFTNGTGPDSISSQSESPDTLPEVSKILFDWQLYLGINHDLTAAGLLTSTSALSHWVQQGIYECRRSALVFDPNYYKKLLSTEVSQNVRAWSTNCDSVNSYYLKYGINEKRRASLEFDVEYYLKQYPDLRAAFGNNYAAATEHFQNHGIAEGRTGSAEFSIVEYLDRYEDLQQAYGPTNYYQAYIHWLSHGKQEGRNGRPTNLFKVRGALYQLTAIGGKLPIICSIFSPEKMRALGFNQQQYDHAKSVDNFPKILLVNVSPCK